MPAEPSGARARVAGNAYPWDIEGDPGFVDRIGSLGLDEVTVAAHYHSVRAATPLHPRHQVVTARRAASYRPVRRSAWRGRRLAPVAADWVGDPDSFATGAAALRAAGMRVNAWIVFNHDTRLGERNPDLAVVNCFGDAYPYALCPQHDEVRDYAALLASESTRDVVLDGVVVEAWGQLGIRHGGRHEKTADAWSAEAERLLSICCCAACRDAWRRTGVAPGWIVGELRRAVIALSDGRDAALPDEAEQVMASARRSAAARSLAGILDGVRSTAPTARITVHAHPSVWSEAPIPAVGDASAGRVDALQVSAWATGPDSAEPVAVAADLAPAGCAIAAYASVLPPAEADDLGGHIRRLAASGAHELHLYHLGLASSERLRRMPVLIDDFRARTAAGR